MAGRVGFVPFAPTSTYDYGPGSRISELILRAGENAARAQAAQGDIWGSAVANLGADAGQAIQGYQAQKAAEAKARFEQEQKAKLGSLVSRAQDPDAEIQDLLADISDELKPQAFEVISKVKTAQSEGAKRRREAEEHETYGMAVAADALDQVLGTPLEDMARKKLFGLFAESNPDQVAQLQGLPAEQLRPLLQNLKSGSNKWTEEQAKIASTEAQRKATETGITQKDRELDLRAAEDASEAAARADARKLGWAQLGETRLNREQAAKAAKASEFKEVNGVLHRIQPDGTLVPATGPGGVPLATAPTTPKPLSAPDASKLALVKELESNLTTLRDRVDKAPRKTAYQATASPVLGGDPALQRVLSNTTDQIGRLRSQGSVTEDEEARFKNLLVQANDLYAWNPKGSLAAIDSVLSEVATIKNAMGQGGSGLTPEGAALQEEIQRRLAGGK